MEEWEQVILDMTGSGSAKGIESEIDLVGYYYGYVGWSIQTGLGSTAKRYTKEGLERIDDLLELYPENPELYAFKGAFTGFKIEMSPIKAPVLGPQSMKNINRALEIDPECAQAWIEKGNAISHMPPMFGGSKTEALELYTKAISLMESNSSPRPHDWIYLYVLFVQGKLYQELEMEAESKAVFDKILQLEPGFTLLDDLPNPPGE
jgi:tetratricopeptide (TPR) repeat protein